jgi:hypothetical protein
MKNIFLHQPKLRVMGNNTTPAGNPSNHGNLEKAQPFVFDDFTLYFYS